MENQEKIIQALRQLSVQTGSLACLGCGHEHNCGIHGCAIINEAIEKLGSSGWISVQEGLPEEHDSFFAKFYGTSRWHDGMFRYCSHEVLVTIAFEDGQKLVQTCKTHDGKWNLPSIWAGRVTHWMEKPKPAEV